MPADALHSPGQVTQRKNAMGLVLVTHPAAQDLAVYVDLVGGNGDYVVRVDLVHVDTGVRTVLPMSGQTVALRPESYFIATFKGKGITFGKVGGYRIQLYLNGEFIAEARFAVLPQEGITQLVMDASPADALPG
jgi:hypothetical protein